jgi:hypothetical protein
MGDEMKTNRELAMENLARINPGSCILVNTAGQVWNHGPYLAGYKPYAITLGRARQVRGAGEIMGIPFGFFADEKIGGLYGN